MVGIAGKVARIAFASALAAGLVLAGSAAARADAGEEITKYDVDVAVHSDGTAHVRETITYDFGTNARHGIYRKILYSVPAGDDRRQEMDVTGIRASSPDGAPAQTDVTDDGKYQEVRIGDPDRTVTGTHTYVIDYDTDHVATKAGGGVRYAWNAVGEEWDVPVSDVTARLTGPAAMSAPQCFAGTPGSSGTSCDSADATGTEARFTQSRVESGQGLTVQADLPAGSVTVAPKYEHVSDPGEASDEPILPTTGTGIATGVLLLLAAAVYGYVRHRRAAITRRPGMPGLPDGITPGLAAYLHSPSGEQPMLIGTLLDLARRGFLRIDDIPGKKRDWMLTRTAPWDPALAPHEQALLRGLFTGRDQVTVSRLHNQFRSTVGALTRALADDARRRGWLREPYQRWVVLGCAAPFFLFAASELMDHDLPGWPFLLAASALVAVVIAGTLAPLFRFSAAGEDAQRQVEALRRQLADPAGAQQFDPAWALPYAAVFGQAGQWEARTGSAARIAWYSGVGLAAFTTSAGSSMVSSPSSGSGSSGGGFSGGSVGGGGGGGGGGSW